MIGFNVWSEKNTGINSEGCQPVDDQTECTEKGQSDLGVVYVRENEILTNK